MEARRRTLMSEGGPMGNALPASSIPVPSSAMKKGNYRMGSSRMSMIPGPAGLAPPGRISSSQQSNGHGGSNGGGGTLSHSASQENLRRSTLVPSQSNRGDAYGKTPQKSVRSIPGSVRRSSVYSGRQSMAPQLLSGTTRDTRPIKTQSYQIAAARNIEAFCRQWRCPVNITEKFWSGSATTKDFQHLVKWLIGEFIDEGYPWNKKFEDDCVQVLKELRYPGLDNISKTTLGSLGSGATWMTLVGMLNWLVELCKAHSNWEDKDIVSDPFRIPAAELPLESPFLQDRIMWDFVSSVYKNWLLHGAENFEEAEEELESQYERIAQGSIDENERLQTELQKRALELQQLQAQEPPLKKLEDEHLQLMSDKTKFISFLGLHKSKAEKHAQAIEKCKQVIANTEEQSQSLRHELAQIEMAVSAQNMSGEEVQRMYHERETLGRNLEELREKINEASKLSYDQEMAVSRAQDRFDQLITDYTALGYQIKVIKHNLDGSTTGIGGVDFTIDIRVGGESIDEIQTSGRRMRDTLRPALNAYGESIRKEMVKLQNSQISLQAALEKLIEEVDVKLEEVANLETKLQVQHGNADEAKARLQAQTAEMNRTVQKLEAEVTSMIASSQQSVAATQTELERKKIAFTELQHKTALLQDSVVKDISTHIELIMKTKEHTANALRNVKTFAESQ